MILDDFLILVNTSQLIDYKIVLMYYGTMDQTNEVLLPEEVAKILGVKRITVKRYMDSKVNPLPHIKLGHKTIRIIRGQLDKWLKSKVVKYS